ncbi:MAG: large subunit ribosomal protein [Solirubrobacteraceae bacterium]|jgi:large subunit ribosomal protein L24|nr:large subunit ribosomal protein [Solirubrobacteraceae bacterium]MEA2335684.1 large subunit ribosomal protein [Solirubrobacteraceae bacterium]
MARATASKGRNKLKIRSDDHVRVTAGKDRGKTGKVLRVEPAKQRLYVEGLNMVKRAVRPQVNQSAPTLPGSDGQLGGVIEREGPIHISNVMLLDAKGNPTRVRIERKSGSRVRVAKSTGAELD